MYGLVNKALQGFVQSQYGSSSWEKIKSKANINIDSFISMQSYPDEVTYQLAAAVSKELQISLEEVLEAFGIYWVRFTAEEGYGQMLELCGTSLKEFLMNLDALHARIGLTFPELRPPSFTCTNITENSLQLHYYSKREGLTSFVIGLIKGLGKKFDTHVKISPVKIRSSGSDHDVFLLEFKNK